MLARLVTLTSLVLALAAAGCGSSSGKGASQASAPGQASSAANAPAAVTPQLIASIDAICTRHDTAASFDPIMGEGSEITRAARKLLAVERTTLAELGKLTVPASMEPGWKRFAVARQKVIKLLINVSEHGGTDVSIQPVGAAIEAMRGAAGEDGLSDCTHEY
jgi:hypothetical protein